MGCHCLLGHVKLVPIKYNEQVCLRGRVLPSRGDNFGDGDSRQDTGPEMLPRLQYQTHTNPVRLLNNPPAFTLVTTLFEKVRSQSLLPFHICSIFFPGATMVESACQCRRSLSRVNSWNRKCNLLQYSCLENSVDRGDW